VLEVLIKISRHAQLSANARRKFPGFKFRVEGSASGPGKANVKKQGSGSCGVWYAAVNFSFSFNLKSNNWQLANRVHVL